MIRLAFTAGVIAGALGVLAATLWLALVSGGTVADPRDATFEWPAS